MSVWMHLLAQSEVPAEFPSLPYGTDGNPTLIFFRMGLPENQLQKSVGGEMVMESRLGA